MVHIYRAKACEVNESTVFEKFIHNAQLGLSQGYEKDSGRWVKLEVVAPPEFTIPMMDELVEEVINSGTRYTFKLEIVELDENGHEITNDTKVIGDIDGLELQSIQGNILIFYGNGQRKFID